MSRPSIFRNLVGERFGRLVVAEEAGKRNNGEIKWLCQCDCGGTAVVTTSNLKRGNSTSCGCVRSIIPMEEYECKKRIELENNTNAWEYVRCHDRARGRHIIKCRVCGSERIVSSVAVVPQCGFCIKQQELSIRELERLLNKQYKCRACGEVFERRSTQQVLCKPCRDAEKRKKANAKSNLRKRLREAKAKENGKVDYSITLSKLIKRDKGICQLCGREVNESDYVYVNDAFIAGNDYPSIDHIKPLSKGGVHQWDNVQLAHRICNSIKCDNEWQ